MIEVFLSASVPLPDRDRRFFETADVIAIREAVKGLVEVVLPIGRITFGGHPAITPLIALFIREAGLGRDRMRIFQSQFFDGSMPDENRQFYDLRLVRTVAGDRNASLLAMRREMVASAVFDWGVFIGGMEGVVEEASMFTDANPRAKLLPLASTGAAAAIVYNSGKYPEDVGRDMTYPSLFRKYILGKNELKSL